MSPVSSFLLVCIIRHLHPPTHLHLPPITKSHPLLFTPNFDKKKIKKKDGISYSPLDGKREGTERRGAGEQRTCCLSKTRMGGEYGWNEVFAFGLEREGEKTTANLRMMVKMFSPEAKNKVRGEKKKRKGRKVCYFYLFIYNLTGWRRFVFGHV